MEISEILGQFEKYTGTFPRAAVEAAIERREEIAPELLRVLEETLDRAEQSGSGSEYNAHFYALYLLAQFRETRAYPLVVRLALLPSKLLDELCGDFVTETLGKVLASVCGGDLGGIKLVIENPDACEWARSASLKSLVTLVAVGEKSREEIVGYFAHLFQGGLERRECYVWAALVHGCYDLWPGELHAEIERAYEDELVDQFSIGMGDVRCAMESGVDGCLARLATSHHHRLVVDTVKEYGGWACFKPKEPKPDRPGMKSGKHLALFTPKRDAALKVGRNDPCPCGSGKKYKKCCLQ